SVWDTGGGKELLTRALNGPKLLAISPDGERIAVPVGVGPKDDGTSERIGEILVVRVTDNTVVQRLQLDSPPDMCHAAFAPSGNGLVTAAAYFPRGAPAQMSVRIWDITAGNSKEVVGRTSISAITDAIAFSPDGALVATVFHPPGPSPGVVDVWEVASGTKR